MLSTIPLLTILFSCNANNAAFAEASPSTLEVFSINGVEVKDNALSLKERQFWDLYSKKENLLAVSEYSCDPSSTVTAEFIDSIDVVRFTETFSDSKTIFKDFNVQVEDIFFADSIENVKNNVLPWNKAENAYTFDENLDDYKYGLCVFDGTSTKGRDFSATFNVSLKELQRYGEFQIKVAETLVKEARLVLKMYDDDVFYTFTDFRKGSYFYGESEHIVESGYSSQFMEISVIKKGDSVSFVKDGSLVNTLSIPNFAGGLVVGGASIKGLVRNVDISFDTSTIESTYNYYNEGRPSIGIGTTLIGKGSPAGFDVAENKISVNGSNNPERVFGSIVANDLPINSNRFIVKGVLKTKNTGNAEEGKAGKVEFQIYQNAERYMKFFVYRYDNGGLNYNNSFYVQGNNSLTGETIPLTCAKSNCFPLGAGKERFFATRFEFIYDTGNIYVFFDDQLYYQYASNWGDAGFAIGMTQYADVSWENIQYIEDAQLINNRVSGLNPFNEDHRFGTSSLTGEGAPQDFKIDGSSYFIKTNQNYSKAYVYDSSNSPVKGNEFYLRGNIRIEDCLSYCQGEILIENADGNGYRFCLEFLPSGYYQVFTERTNGTSNSDYSVVVQEKARNQNNIDFGILFMDNKVIFEVNGFVRFAYSDVYLGTSNIALGGKGGTVKVNKISSCMNHSGLENIKANLQEYVEKSDYENRIAAYEEKYASYEDNGLLLLGSSSLDYWKTYEEDLEGVDMPIYNCGIGGTCVVDWLSFMMERLVYAHSPSKILLFLGGNGIGKYTVPQVGAQIEEIVTLIHSKLPSTHIYVLEQKPAIRPNKTLTQYKQLNAIQKTIVNKYPSYLSYIENWNNYYREDGVLNREYFVDDGMHLSATGYEVWTSNVRKGLGLN